MNRNAHITFLSRKIQSFHDVFSQDQRHRISLVLFLFDRKGIPANVDRVCCKERWNSKVECHLNHDVLGNKRLRAAFSNTLENRSYSCMVLIYTFSL